MTNEPTTTETDTTTADALAAFLWSPVGRPLSTDGCPAVVVAWVMGGAA